jgi:hypothetical protein
MAKRKPKKGKRRTLDPSEGGRAVVKKLGREHMVALAKKAAAKRDPDYYSRLGRASAAARRRLIEAGRAALGE